MDARSLLTSGDVQGAVAAAKQEVRKTPGDVRLRTFLFQLFCITGEWDRAVTQLKMAGELDAKAADMVTTYQALIRCELLREKIFRGERVPTLMGDPGEWAPLLIEANRLLAQGESARAAELRDRAFDAAPSVPATIGEAPCEWAADADPRLGPIFEAIVEGRYFWIPYSRVKALRIEKPADLRDMVWLPVQFTWTNEGEAIAFIPTRYPGSATSADPLVQLARKTDWVEHSEDWALPIGQRMIATDAGETALLDLRALTLQHTTEDAQASVVPA